MRKAQKENFKLNIDSPSVGYEESAISKPTSKIIKNAKKSTKKSLNIDKNKIIAPETIKNKTIQGRNPVNETNKIEDRMKVSINDDKFLNSIEILTMKIAHDFARFFAFINFFRFRFLKLQYLQYIGVHNKKVSTITLFPFKRNA